MSGVSPNTIDVRLGLEKVRPGMITARDVLGPNDLVLIAKDNVINDTSYLKMFQAGVKEVYVKKASINASKRAIVPEDFDPEPESEPDSEPAIVESVSISKQADFKVFLAHYNENLKAAENKIRSISDGAKVNLEELYAISSASMEKLRCKSDILSYIGFLKTHDEFTFGHSNNVALLCNLFSYWLGLGRAETLFLTTAGLLHDVGKTKIPSPILSKKSSLTPREYDMIKTHTAYGYQILKDQDIPDPIKQSALLHHERIDGTGYPFGKKGTEITKFAKIIGICDVYEAMTSDRPYRKKYSPFEVIKHFEMSCFGQLDTAFLLVFLKNIAYTYYGRWIRLEDGRKGEIVFINPSDLSRPMIKVNEEIIDLHDRVDIKIQSII